MKIFSKQSIVLVIATFLISRVKSQPADASKSIPFLYEIQLNTENVFCHLTNGDCFNGPYGVMSLNKDVTVTPITNGWQIKIISTKWQQDITLPYLNSLTWHPTFGRAWVTFGEKDTTFHRSVPLLGPVGKPSYLVEQGNPAAIGIKMSTVDCFSPSPNFVVVKGNKGWSYMIRVNWHFTVAICKQDEGDKHGQIIISVASPIDQQPTEVENLHVFGDFRTFTAYPNSKYSQAVIKYGKQQLTIEIATCKVMQAKFGMNINKNEELVYSAHSGWVAQKTGFASLRNNGQNYALGGLNSYFFYCLAEKGLYVNSKFARIANGIKTLVNQGLVVIDVALPKGTGPVTEHCDEAGYSIEHLGGGAYLSDYLKGAEENNPYKLKA